MSILQRRLSVRGVNVGRIRLQSVINIMLMGNFEGRTRQLEDGNSAALFVSPASVEFEDREDR